MKGPIRPFFFGASRANAPVSDFIFGHFFRLTVTRQCKPPLAGSRLELASFRIPPRRH
jgi:hypothetical protein